MIRRCNKESNKDYHRYGGRGIRVCERWSKFTNFVEDMGIPESGMTIDRIDNDGAYDKDNCRWVTNKEQQRNKSTSRLLDIDGVVKCVVEWCDFYNLSHELVRSRLKYGWTAKEALCIIPRNLLGQGK
jgi:hypothetical protein